MRHAFLGKKRVFVGLSRYPHSCPCSKKHPILHRQVTKSDANFCN